MKISEITIKNFRGIEKIEGVKLDSLSLLIGENGLSKTAILEAINFALSPSFLSDRLEHRDFHNGTDDPIEVMVKFDSNFSAFLPDGFAKQEVLCNAVFLKAKKRDKAKSGKAFSDLVVTEHYVVPNRPKDTDKGWTQPRKGGSPFQFDYRLLAFPVETEGLPRSFYFNRERGKQIKKGFRTTINSVLNDFNWRYLRAVRKAEPKSEIPAQKEKLEEAIIGTIDPKILKATIDEVNGKLSGFRLPNIGLSIFDGSAPFDGSFLSHTTGELDLPTDSLGSGVEMIVSLVFLETLASMSKESIIILIDEPELHLHPGLQLMLAEYFRQLSSQNQVVVSSHSPYIHKSLVNSKGVELIRCAKEANQKLIVTNSSTAFNLFKWSPTWSEVNYFAFNLPSVEFHNELYGAIQEKQKAFNTNAMEAYLMSKGLTQNTAWIKEEKGVPQPSINCTLPTFVRHSIHHPENKHNPSFSEVDLKASIDLMITIIQNP